MKKIKRNPNLKGEEFIDDHFLELLFSAILYNVTRDFQKALIYKNIGKESCEDCSKLHLKKYHYDCTCEDYLDDYNIPINNSNKTSPELIDAVKKQFRYLSLQQLLDFKKGLSSINYNKLNPYLQESDNKKLINYINNLIAK